jgi:hypothetical protein
MILTRIGDTESAQFGYKPQRPGVAPPRAPADSARAQRPFGEERYPPGRRPRKPAGRGLEHLVAPGLCSLDGRAPLRIGRARTLDEHLFVRFPVFYRLTAAVLMRLLPRSRLRRSMVARRVRRAYAEANRWDFDVVLVGRDAQSEYHPSETCYLLTWRRFFHGHGRYHQPRALKRNDVPLSYSLHCQR